MKEYEIIPVSDICSYNYLVVMCSDESPFNYFQLILNDLKEKNYKGKILIDQLLHVGNNNERFLCFDNEDEIIKDIEFQFISKHDTIRKKSCDCLKKNDLINYSILTTIQKRMINKGITI